MNKFYSDCLMFEIYQQNYRKLVKNLLKNKTEIKFKYTEETNVLLQCC